ncbi:hypothetical protein ACFXK0_08030 [Nocardia sp. NPDC059177]|uniref:hypothetical protein n=1 Tax=Nocardia sp. NPDC059177 TaxID=3346759 RepID=UPI00367A6912
MRSSISARSGIACAAAALAMLSFPATAFAQPAPDNLPVDLTTTVTGTTIDYTVTDVPNRRDTFPVIRGECTTAAVDTIAAAPILGTAALNSLSGRQPDAPDLLQRLIAAGAVAAGPRIQIASNTGEITGSFPGLARGVYVVVTLCNINPFGFEFDPDLFDASPAVVTDLGSGSGSGSGS